MYKLQLFTFILFTLFFYDNVQAQELTFTVYQGEKELGNIIANKTIADEHTTYTIKSDVTFVVFKKYHRVSTLVATYHDGILESASSTTHTNDKLEEQRITFHDKEKYACTDMNEVSSCPETAKIIFSSANLYYNEPIDKKKVYSERFFTYASIEDIGNHVYKITFGKGKVNYYKYKDGILDSIEVQRLGFHLKFIRN